MSIHIKIHHRLRALLSRQKAYNGGWPGCAKAPKDDARSQIISSIVAYTHFHCSNKASLYIVVVPQLTKCMYINIQQNVGNTLFAWFDARDALSGATRKHKTKCMEVITRAIHIRIRIQSEKFELFSDAFVEHSLSRLCAALPKKALSYLYVLVHLQSQCIYRIPNHNFYKILYICIFMLRMLYKCFLFVSKLQSARERSFLYMLGEDGTNKMKAILS